MELTRSPEVSAVLWTILILCVLTIGYLILVPEAEQQKAKAAADAFTATATFSGKKDEKKEE